jgi:hypothetical protein
MSIPEKYLTIRNKFAKALKTGDLSEVNAIPLDDVKLAKVYLSSDSTQPYYALLLHTIKERERATLDNKEGVKVSGVESNYAKNEHIFLAHKFAEDDLVVILKKTIEKHKYLWAEAKKNDLGKISADILVKIKNCGFFIAILTKQHELQGGNFTANSWLIEEKGAALAFGQRPFVMVEEGIERHYVGFVQNDDQIINFNTADFSVKVEDVVKKIDTIYKKYLGQDLI